MGHDISMIDEEGKVLTVTPFKGGRYRHESDRAEVSVTYNYAWFFYKFLDHQDGIKIIYGQLGRVAEPLLDKAIAELTSNGMGNGEDIIEYDYWTPTPSNVTKILRLLKSWCVQHPNGKFEGD